MKTGNEQYIIDKLNSMTIDEARKAIAKGQFRDIGSIERAFASELLATKEASLRDSREEETLLVAKDANRLAEEANSISKSMRLEVRKDRIIAIIAIIIAVIAARADIIWFISWIVSKIKTS